MISLEHQCEMFIVALQWRASSKCILGNEECFNLGLGGNWRDSTNDFGGYFAELYEKDEVPTL